MLCEKGIFSSAVKTVSYAQPVASLAGKLRLKNAADDARAPARLWCSARHNSAAERLKNSFTARARFCRAAVPLKWYGENRSTEKRVKEQ
ncbi:MAG TPA: hypothetical protein DCM44_10840 [Pantoea sp.]|uniref:hypothetical protein n=1 Tax=Pantoea TaxID=53335 RepID=UPI000BB53353|nr:MULTISPECIES: hypothetical protein [Pantoea]PNK64133.1 hypothetical protein A6J33_015780 [Pantoea sp. FDAARGOS_194]HAK35108.1 hypothetical protein [Pantoea sp.]